MKTTQALWVALGLSLIGCGQEPSFLNTQTTTGKSSNQEVNTSGGFVDENGQTVDENGQTVGKNGEGRDSQGNGTEGTDTEGENGSDGEIIIPGDGQSDGTPGGANGEESDEGSNDNGTSAGTTNPVKPTVPGASESDLDALQKCLAKWNGNPFTGSIRNYKKISASVSVRGIGNLINDNESTAQPFLTLVDAGVNVLGSPTYNLLNKNGYYCIKVNVNVSTNLNINLHCNARLADQKLNVNVGSTQNETTSAVGVHVLSNVQINTVRPQGHACIR